MINADDIKKLKDDFGTAQSMRATWEGIAQDIIDYMMPMRPDIIAPEFEVQGRDKMGFIFNSHATHAGELMAAGIAARLVNAAIDWFRVLPRSKRIADNREVKLWSDEVKTVLENCFEIGNFYTTYHENLVDKIFLGSACMFIGHHPTLKIYFESLNLGECYPSINQYGGVDKLYRKFMLSLRSLAAKFGESNISPANQKKLAAGGSNTEERVAVLHAVKPRQVRNHQGRDRLNKRFEDVYLEFDTNHVLREGGYDEFPFVFSRYDSPPGHIMGRGPGWTALPDVMQLQQMEKDLLTANQRALGPSLLLPSSLNGPMIDLTPNGVTFIDAESGEGKVGAFPLGNLATVVEDREQKKKDIDDIFFKDLMAMAIDPRVTATQFIGAAQEQMQLFGPFVLREQFECLNRVFRRTFNVLWEAGDIPPPPPALMEEGGQIKIDYIGPLALAQMASRSKGIVQTVGFIEQIMNIDPSVKNRFNFDEALQEVAGNNGCPAHLLRSDEEVAQINQVQAKMQQEKEEQAMMLQAAKAVPELGKKVEPTSPMGQLGQILRQGGGTA